MTSVIQGGSALSSAPRTEYQHTSGQWYMAVLEQKWEPDEMDPATVTCRSSIGVVKKSSLSFPPDFNQERNIGQKAHTMVRHMSSKIRTQQTRSRPEQFRERNQILLIEKGSELKRD